ncbi:NAD(P)H-binding protein [Nonomuraea sp. NPDC049152]|uniref:NAD(P)H-binding protein n=1 Tax=Nonomuraea sp. NPDC049152 TaxID=3154350 RepID=UPI0033CEF53B
MKITLFGATGGVGRQLLRQALEAGHQVTAVVQRRPRRQRAPAARLRGRAAARRGDRTARHQ